uniref:Uncharacterized protein n=1 Tax=Glossina pallidipes TaxID=7398 RepID=A0A1A9ZLS9_GLOPL
MKSVTGEFKGPMLAGAQCDMLCTCIVLRLLVPPPFPPPTVVDDIPPSFPSVVPIADKPIDETANDRLPQTAAVLLPNRRGEPKVPAWREAAHRAADEESKFNGIAVLIASSGAAEKSKLKRGLENQNTQAQMPKPGSEVAVLVQCSLYLSGSKVSKPLQFEIRK